MSGDRAQINFDFAVGVSLLAISMIVALTMVPSLFGGVTEGQMQGDQVAADRVASNLAEGGLGDASRPNEVDGVCALGLFDSSEDFCGFYESDVGENVGIEDRNVNVEIRGYPDPEDDEERLCWHNRDNAVEEADTESCTPFEGGGNHESTNELASATRIVSIDGINGRIIVRVW